MYLNKSKLEFRGHTIELCELSALARLEYLRWVAAEYPDAPEESQFLENSFRLMRCNARIIALSQQATSGDDTDSVCEEIIRTWPAELLGKAATGILKLSGMINDKEPEGKTQPVSPKKR